MRKIVAGLFITLDGVVEAPNEWNMAYFNDEMGAAIGGLMASGDTMLLGRRTYEEFAAFWPQQSSDDEMAQQMNGIPKLVVSTTLDEATWENTTIIKDDVIGTLTRLKEQPGKDLNITGSGTLVLSLLRAGILDELVLMVHPLALGHGKRLFTEGEQLPLTLTNSQTFSTGVVLLTYAAAPQA